MATVLFSIILFIFSIFFLLYIFNMANILWSTLFRKESPFIPLQKSVLRLVAKEMAITEGSLVYDLGCGDGRVIFFLAKRYPKGRYIGVEKYILPFMLAKINFFFYGRPKNIKIIKNDMFNCNLSAASHIFLYLFPGHVDKIYAKFEKELKKGTRVISCGFPVKNKNAQKIIEIPKNAVFPRVHKKLYVYEF